jgi:propanol-preferring alcohol dehydrogenase
MHSARRPGVHIPPGDHPACVSLLRSATLRAPDTSQAGCIRADIHYPQGPSSHLCGTGTLAMPLMMRAMLLDHPAPVEQRPLSLQSVPCAEPGPEEIRLRVLACGVCHTDLHTVEGELAAARLPIIPGHQVIGEVESIGPSVTGWQAGERAGVAWLNWSCGRCEFCARGEENLCDRARFTGLSTDGGYAEYLTVNHAYALRLPVSLEAIEGAPLLCAGIIGYRALRLAQVQPGERVGLFGFGASAHLAIQVARFWQCEAFVFTRGEYHRRQAEALGAAWTGTAEDRPPAQLDRAVIFAPSGALVPLALERLRKGGTLAINAIHMSPLPSMPYALLYGERTLRSVANATRRDGQEFLRLAAEIPIHVDVTEFPLGLANEALAELKAGRITGAAVLRVQEG